MAGALTLAYHGSASRAEPPGLDASSGSTTGMPPGLRHLGWAATVSLIWMCSTVGPPDLNYYGYTTMGGAVKAMPPWLDQVSCPVMDSPAVASEVR